MNEHLENLLVEIRIDSEDAVKGCYTLLTSSYSIVCLPDNKYIVPRRVLKELEKYSINFKIVK